MDEKLLSRIGTYGLTMDSYTASTTYRADHPASAFDGYYDGDGSITDTKVLRGGWYSASRKNQWLQIDFGTNKFIITKLRYHDRTSVDQIPKDCILQASNDNIQFEDIKEFQIQQVRGWQEFSVSTNKKYRYCRLFIYSNWGESSNLIEVGELEYYGYEAKYKFLLKQNNQYYTIKPEYYSNGQFQPLTLEGGTTPNENDYENFGFDDLNDLLVPIQVGEENFTPYDKLNDEFEIHMATDKEGGIY